MLFTSLLSFAALAAGNPILQKYAEDFNNLEARAGVSQANFNSFKFYVQHAAAAYCNPSVVPGDKITCKNSVCADVEKDGVYAIDSFQGSTTGIAAYAAVDDVRREIVVSVRGSNNVRNFITDVVFAWKNCDFTSGCKVHTGFAAAWDEIKDSTYSAIKEGLQANPSYRVVITGHSLGGAVAILGGTYLRRDGYKVDVYTFGSPRVGNDIFANYASGQSGTSFRVTHTDDPVPRLPPIIFGYRHTTPEIWLSTGSSSNRNYQLGDLQVCSGIANTKCNAGTFGLDIIAHLNYMSDTAGCAPFPPKFKRDDVSNEDLEKRLNDWSSKDQAYKA